MLTRACAAQAPAPPAQQMAPPAAVRPVAPALMMPLALPPSGMIAPVPVLLPPPTDAMSLRARYGAPDFLRRETDSELWRYDGDACAVFFFLYREGDVMKLRYSETMPRGMEMAADPACVESLNGRAGSMP